MQQELPANPLSFGLKLHFRGQTNRWLALEKSGAACLHPESVPGPAIIEVGEAFHSEGHATPDQFHLPDDLMEMILPAAAEISFTIPRLLNSLTASRAQRNCPVRFTSRTRCQSVKAIWSKGESFVDC